MNDLHWWSRRRSLLSTCSRRSVAGAAVLILTTAAAAATVTTTKSCLARGIQRGFRVFIFSSRFGWLSSVFLVPLGSRFVGSAFVGSGFAPCSIGSSFSSSFFPSSFGPVVQVRHQRLFCQYTKDDIGSEASSMEQILKEHLCSNLEPCLFRLIDTTPVGGGCGASFDCLIVSSAFNNLPLLQRQRLVNETLTNFMDRIHSFTMKCYTPLEWDQIKH